MTDADKGKRPADQWTVEDREIDRRGGLFPVACAGVNVAYFVFRGDAVAYAQRQRLLAAADRKIAT